MVRNAFREVLICLLNPELVSLLFIASSSLNLTNFYRKFFITSNNSMCSSMFSTDHISSVSDQCSSLERSELNYLAT